MTADYSHIGRLCLFEVRGLGKAEYEARGFVVRGEGGAKEYKGR